MGPRVSGAAGPSISVVGSGTRNIAKTNFYTLAAASTPAAASVYPSHAYRAYRWGIVGLMHLHALDELWPAIGSKKKVGFRFGGKGVMPLGLLFPWPTNRYLLPHVARFPVPTYGFGFTSVPVHESRWPSFPEVGHSPDQGSRNGQLAETNSDRATEGRGSAPRSGGSVPAPSNGRPSSPNRRNGTSRNTLRISPWCRSHRRRHWCPVTRRR